MAPTEQPNFRDEFPRLNLESLTALQRKLIIDLIRQKHPHFWSEIRSNTYYWGAAKKQLEQFIKVHQSELIAELRKTSFNHDDFSRKGEQEDGGYGQG